MSTADDFREWKPDKWFDRGFLHSVPSSARREFLRAVRPLSDGLSKRVVGALFAGVKQPFHYVRASGWMARLLRTEPALPAAASVEQREACLRERLAWQAAEVVLLVYHQPSVYAMCWGGFLGYFRKDWLCLDTMLVCHPKAREVALFWEDGGPIFGKHSAAPFASPGWGGKAPDKVSASEAGEG